MLQIFKDTLKRVPGAKNLAREVRRRIRIYPALPAPAAPQKSLMAMLSEADPSQSTMDVISQSAANYSLAWAAVEYKRGNYDLASSIAQGIRPDVAAEPRILSKTWESMRDLGRHDLAIRGLNAKRPDPAPAGFQARIEHTIFAQSAFTAFSKYATEKERPNPRGYVVMFDLGSRVTTGLMVPLAFQLVRDGYSVCSAVAGTMPKSKLPELASISCMMKPNGSGLTSGERGLQNDWVVAWEDGVVSCAGVNYFTFFLERISKLARSYRGGLNTDEAQKLFEDLLRRSDLAITMCRRLLSLAETGKPIRVVTMESHFAPWGIVRRWCDTTGRAANIHLVGLSIAYENYFSNLKSLEAKTLSIEDLTANPDLRHPFLGGRRRFEKYQSDIGNAVAPEREQQALSWIKVDRSRARADSDQRKIVVDAVSAARAEGRRSFCVLGKVLIDFAAPDDQGHVFDDFTGWLNALIAWSEQHNSVLIIKPHPHEIREEIVQSGVQLLRHLLPEKLPANVIFLDHSSFNSSELAEIVDAAFVWNGTANAEFPILGCTVFSESVWAARDYPIDNPVLMTAADYLNVFNGSTALNVTSANRNAAIDYLHFMRSDAVAIPFRYMRRAGTNQAIGANLLYQDELTELEQHGDPYVALAASRFFEYAENQA